MAALNFCAEQQVPHRRWAPVRNDILIYCEQVGLKKVSALLAAVRLQK